MTERKIAYVITLIFLVLGGRLFQLQLIQGNELRRLSEENRLQRIKIPSPRGVIYDRNGIPLVENMPYYCVILLPEAADTVDIESISELLGVSKEDVQKKIEDRKPFEPIRLKERLSMKEVAFIEARLSDYPGIQIEVDLARHYLYGDVGAHVIGYLGKLNPEQAKSPGLKDIPAEAFIGQWGIEKLFDDILRGVPGEKIIEVDALGRELRVVGEVPTVKGKDLHISIDIQLQKEAETAFGNRAGALVALKPDTGEILALVSRPSFDPNLFAKGISPEDWLQLRDDGRFPMLNRALQSQYPPGSVFKIVTAISALEKEAINLETKITCSGGLTHGKWSFRCWKKAGHGTLSFHDALVQSCDVYFYTAGRRTGINSIAEYARELGVGSPCGLELVKGEKPGFMPDENWKIKAKGQPWYQGETYITSIGQGYVLMTPLQVARLISIVANGGYMYDVTLILPEETPKPIKRLNISQKTFEILRNALWGVVNEPGGTAHSARSKIVEIAGKTGTAQVRSSKAGSASGRFGDHAWFTAYAPYENPQVAIAVLVEHGGHGASAAAPIAKAAIEAYISRHLKAGEDE